MNDENKNRICPKCGSDSGYQYKSEYIQQEKWEGEPIWAGQCGNCTTFKSKYCIDCNANVTAFVNKKVLK